MGRRALLNEIRAAKQISHPNVVRILHVDEGTIPEVGPYACMEYVGGGTLARLLRSQLQAGKQIPLGRAIEMMIEISQGMQAINEKLVHRDVKPDNILIDMDGNTMKIADFGISKFVDESTRLSTFKGGQHIKYMAPEGWVNEKNTFKLDVYATGLVFFEILTLTHPLVSSVKDPSSMRDWERAHLYAAVPSLRVLREEAPLSIVQLVSRMTAKRPQDRPAWDETLRVLSNPTIDPASKQHPAIGQAVAQAVAKRQEQERLSLETARKARDSEMELSLYQQSCKMLLERISPQVDQFNQSFQLGKIGIVQDGGATLYRLPIGATIEVSFFAPRETDIKISGAIVIGGGWIGLTEGRSANLVLLKKADDDIYGEWTVCEVSLMALVDPGRIIGRFGITERTIQPFGFKDQYFYEQIYWAQGGMHAFTYHFVPSVEDYFAMLISEACK
jgi:serine/threonine protein kinase